MYYNMFNMKKGALSIFLFVALLGCKKETPQTIPVITTTSVSSITANSVISGGSISNNGGSEITEKGICWSKNPNPTVTDNKISNGKGSEPFTSNITGLTGGTQYYVRAYAINTTGTGYGSDVSFTTTATLATFTTPLAFEITDTSSNVAVTIQSNGGANITERGICWGITDNPTINNNKIIYTNTQSFNSISITIPKLTFESKYFVRAYAINSAGISYSNSINFTTLPQRVVDIEGNSYRTVRIGNQIWMAENLRVTKFNNGEKIAYSPAASLNSPLVEYVWVENDTAYKNLLGALYSDGVVLSNKIVAPKGYHIPTVTEFNTLIATLGGEASAAAALKSGNYFYFKGNAYGFYAQLQTITNSSQFSLLPAGEYSWGLKNFGKSNAYLWTSDGKNVIAFYNGSNTIKTVNNLYTTSTYFSIRCIKD